MAGNGGMCDAGRAGTHQHFSLRIVLLHGIGYGVLHEVAHLGRREDEAVVAIYGTLYTAGPGERLVRAQENGLDAQQAFGYFFFSHIFCDFASFIQSFSRRSRPCSGGRRPRDPERR